MKDKETYIFCRWAGRLESSNTLKNSPIGGSIICSLFVVILMLVPAVICAGERRTFPSPDRTLRAVVIPVSQTDVGGGESRVEVRLAWGFLRFAKSYWSTDGEHGWNVVHASWTPNSRFFVFSLQSSGGHQAWHSPIYFYDRHSNRLRSLDDQLGPITAPEFTIEAPDVIYATGRRTQDLEEVSFRVSLSSLVRP